MTDHRRRGHTDRLHKVSPVLSQDQKKAERMSDELCKQGKYQEALEVLRKAGLCKSNTSTAGR